MPRNSMRQPASHICIHTLNDSTRLEVKVTATHKHDKALRGRKMKSHTKFGIPISNNIDMLRVRGWSLG